MVARIDPVDGYIGSRMRMRRTLLGMSQEKLGEILGLTFQQVQKYERGANRISAGRLFKIGCALDVPVSFFFDDLPAQGGGRDLAATGRREPSPDRALEPDVMNSRETLELVRAFLRIKDASLRNHVASLIKSVAEPPSAAKPRGRPSRRI